jgi:hypothetical protein
LVVSFLATRDILRDEALRTDEICAAIAQCCEVKRKRCMSHLDMPVTI